MQYRCHLCKLRFDREEGSDVRCPRCQAVVRAPVASPAAPAPASNRCGCPNCLRVFQEGSGLLRCPYCGEKVEQEEGRRLVPHLEGLAGKVKKQLLEGVAAPAIVSSLTEHSIPDDRAFAFVDQLVLDLPFERMARRKAGERFPLPQACDACGRQEQLTPYEAEWQLTPEEMQRYRKGWGGFEGEFSDPSKYSRAAFYYLCKACGSENPASFAGGYPAKNGFVRTRFTKV